MVTIINYDRKYAEEIDKLDQEYWGICETTNVSDEIRDQDIVKLAKLEDYIVGIIHFKPIGDLIDAYHLLVKPENQGQGIGNLLMKEALKETLKNDFKTVIAHAVEFEGNINAKKILETNGFQELYRVKNYWESLYPGSYCKQCNSYQCHCGVVVYRKNL
ncbi:MAG: GNAT family N-acetyltransferase [Bacilli bacterium]|nr:GNAT family N-acetyltransferase [Bacilli bacterium]